MEMEEREAVQELLKKIPEDKLAEAVGGMSERSKNILTAMGVFVAGIGAGIGGKLAWDKWGPKEKVKAKVKAPILDELRANAEKYLAIIKDKNKPMKERITAAAEWHKTMSKLGTAVSGGAAAFMSEGDLQQWISSHDKDADGWDKIK